MPSLVWDTKSRKYTVKKYLSHLRTLWFYTYKFLAISKTYQLPLSSKNHLMSQRKRCVVPTNEHLNLSMVHSLARAIFLQERILYSLLPNFPFFKIHFRNCEFNRPSLKYQGVRSDTSHFL